MRPRDRLEAQHGVAVEERLAARPVLHVDVRTALDCVRTEGRGVVGLGERHEVPRRCLRLERQLHDEGVADGGRCVAHRLGGECRHLLGELLGVLRLLGVQQAVGAELHLAQRRVHAVLAPPSRVLVLGELCLGGPVGGDRLDRRPQRPRRGGAVFRWAVGDHGHQRRVAVEPEVVGHRRVREPALVAQPVEAATPDHRGGGRGCDRPRRQPRRSGGTVHVGPRGQERHERLPRHAPVPRRLEELEVEARRGWGAEPQHGVVVGEVGGRPPPHVVTVEAVQPQLLPTDQAVAADAVAPGEVVGDHGVAAGATLDLEDPPFVLQALEEAPGTEGRRQVGEVGRDLVRLALDDEAGDGRPRRAVEAVLPHPDVGQRQVLAEVRDPPLGQLLVRLPDTERQAGRQRARDVRPERADAFDLPLHHAMHAPERTASCKRRR